jgi:hypothetical protein
MTNVLFMMLMMLLSCYRKALMKCVNTIGSTQEISGPMCALQILYDKESYTNEMFVNVNWMAIYAVV